MLRKYRLGGPAAVWQERVILPGWLCQFAQIAVQATDIIDMSVLATRTTTVAQNELRFVRGGTVCVPAFVSQYAGTRPRQCSVM